MIKFSGTPYEGSQVEKFMDDLESISHSHPLDPKARILHNCSVLIFPLDGNTKIHISSMDSLIRGSGSLALREICDLADRYGLDISLVALGYSITPTDRLVTWYSRYGFVKTGMGSRKDGYRMIRKAKNASVEDNGASTIIRLRGFDRKH